MGTRMFATSELVYPVLVLYRDTLYAEETEDFLTKTTSVALRKGLFNESKIIDSNGRQYIVTKARKLHGVGPFWGYNIFLNRWIRVALDLRSSGETLSVDGVRSLVLNDFQNSPNWQTRDDFQELLAAVERASTIAEIIGLVAS